MEKHLKKEFSEEQKAAMKKCISDFLAIVDNPEREGLKETPKRVVNYWVEMLEGQLYTNQEVADYFNKCFDFSDEDDKTVDSSATKNIIIEKGIQVFSHCEHHLSLMYEMNVAIAYIPKNKVIGLSKMGRIAEMCAKRLQLQEKIGEDINEVMRLILNTEDVAVIIEGKHSCMTARGIKCREAVTKTLCMRGLFLTDPTIKANLFDLLK